MGSPSELSLDSKPVHNYSMQVKSFGDQTEQTQKLEEFLSRLEEERLKIDAFKRELPLCMQLLTNAMETSRQQLQAHKANQEGPRPVLEEFIPVKNSTCEEQDNASGTSSDKATWMITAQLWSQAGNETKSQPNNLTTPKEADMIGFNVSPRLGLDNQLRINGGAFLPFSKERNVCPSPTLALSSMDKEMEDKKCLDIDNGFSCVKREMAASNYKRGNSAVAIEQGKVTGNSTTPERHIANNNANNGSNAITTSSNNNVNNISTHGQTNRKARRCWSPDLHRRFVNALQMLGGSQVATPKQIRELMKVDGLTNDEVKSHLQKYRLHTRRPSASPQAPGAPAPQLVVLGGIWVPQEYTTAAAAAHGGPPTLYGTHPASHAPPVPVPTSHFCATPPVTQDFYTAAAAVAVTPPPPPPLPHHQLYHHNLHQQLHVYQATTRAQSSPDSDERGVRDRSESIEDGKSESSSWKGESGENGGERKGIATLREDGEESNGSDITLKF